MPALLIRAMSDDVLREFDLVPIALQLRQRKIDQPQRLLRFEALRIVILGDEDREEHGIDAALFRARKVELAIGHALPDVAAVIQLAIDHVHVSIEDEGVLVQLAGPRGYGRNKERHKNEQTKESGVSQSSPAEVL